MEGDGKEALQRLVGPSAWLKCQAIGLEKDLVSNKNKSKVECNSVELSLGLYT